MHALLDEQVLKGYSRVGEGSSKMTKGQGYLSFEAFLGASTWHF